MESLKFFVASFCTICIVLGVLHFLRPTGAMEKPFVYVLSLVFLSVMLAAAVGIKNFSPKFPEIKQEINTNGEIFELTVRQVFERVLKDGNVKFRKIEVCTDKTEDGSIIINKVTVYSSDPPNRIVELIGNSESYEVIVLDE